MKYSAKISGDQPLAGAAKKVFEPMLEKMANDFEMNIEFIVCHGKRDYIPEMDFDKFYIFAQNTPVGTETETNKIKTMSIDGKKHDLTGGQADITNIISEDLRGMTSICDEDGTRIAVVHDGALYFLTDFCHCGKKEDLDLAELTFKYVINEATKTPELMRALKSGAEEKGKRSLENALAKAFKERLKKEQLQLDSSKKLYDEYMTNMVKAQRKTFSTEKMIKAIMDSIEEIPEAMEKRWSDAKKLEDSSMYETISFQRNSVKGTTTPIFIEYDKKVYEMGKFEVVLDFSGNVKIHSLWPERGPSQDHPHVSSGNPCWGNMSGELPKRIAESEFDVAFVEIHTFLKSYDKHNPYASIDHWPSMSKKDHAAKIAEKQEA